MSLTQTLSTYSPVSPDGTGFLDKLTNKYILGAKGVKGIGGFVFDIPGDIDLIRQADITDHWTEENTVINDHVAIKPLRITLTGYVGELVLKQPQGLIGALNKAQSILSTIPAYLGNYTPQMSGKISSAISSATNVANTINTAISRVGNIVGMFSKATPQKTRQQKAYQQLESLYLNKNIMWLETPYKSFENMIIESLSFTQDETTNTMSNVKVTLKQLRFAAITYQAYNKQIYDSRAGAQRQPAADIGKTAGSNPSGNSWGYDLATGGINAVKGFLK